MNRADVLQMVEGLQRYFVEALGAQDFARFEWLRDEGRHGGGVRFGCAENERFNRASVNVSQVHYDDTPASRLESATALSTIIHPRQPRAPSLHLHISFTQLRGGRGSWRLMADLNPSHEDVAEKEAFEAALRAVAPTVYDEARAAGDRYFFIPALGRHRGVSHFYLEDFETDLAFAERFARAVIDAWLRFFRAPRSPPTPDELAKQLAYHTVYSFQVLTLDRGTTAGLLVHDQNDLGVMGSLPSRVDFELLASWLPRMTRPQDQLLAAIVRPLTPTLSPLRPAREISDQVRRALAQIVRAHYRAHPEAIELQASK